MNALAKALLTTAALGALLLSVPSLAVSQTTPTTATSPLGYGMSASAVSAQTAAGVKPDYGTFWIGPWTLSNGWGGPDNQMTAMKDAGVTPAIHHYYWGDDISQSCIEDGCYSDLHKANKNKEGWQKLTDELIAHLNAKMQGKPVVIFLETEFNKGGVATYEPLDGYLAEKAKQIKAGYPNAKVVMALGNWGHSSWGTWDRTAAASDYVGIQGMRGSTRQSATDYATLYEKTLEGAQVAKAKFGKPVFLQDIAMSTYPEPEYLKRQADEMKDFFAHTADLKAAGVQALIYRSWLDTPTMDTANWYGEAERHWGLNWHGNATLKPAGHVWVEGVKADRAGSSTPTPTSTSPTPTSTSTTTTSSPPPTSSSSSTTGTTNAIAVGGGVTTQVESFATKAAGGKQSDSAAQGGSMWNLWSNGAVAQSYSLASGTYDLTVRARSTALDGVNAHMDVYADGVKVLSADPGASYADHRAKVSGDSATEIRIVYTNDAKSSSADRNLLLDAISLKPATTTATSTSSSGTPTAGSTPYTASFTFGGGANEYWMETKVSSSSAPVKVEVKVGSGAWTPLRQRDPTTWGEEMTVAKGTPVAFRATASDGRSAATASFAYLGSTSPMQATGTSSPTPTATATATATATPTKSATPTSSSSAPSSFKAYFTPRSVGSDWWVEAAVLGNEPVAKVEAKIGGGSWVTLPKTSWGTYGHSVNAPNGSPVTFRATNASGATSLSATVVWT